MRVFERRNIMELSCDQTDSDLELLESVIKLEKQQSMLKMKCNLCEKEFKTKSGLTKHTLTHSSKETCDVCGANFKRKESLVRHRRRFHSHTLNKDSLTYNKTLSKSSLTCDICYKTFSRASNLNRHKTNVHRPRPNFSCRHCDSHFDNYSDLFSHVEQNHPLEQQGGHIASNVENVASTSEDYQANDSTVKRQEVRRRRTDVNALDNGLQNRVIYPERNEGYDVLTFIADVRMDISDFLLSRVNNAGGIKWNVLVHIEMERDIGDGSVTTSTPYFRSSTYVLLNSSTFSEHDLNEALQKIHANMEKYLREGSGWYVKKIIKLEIHTVQYKPLSGSGYVSLPKSLALSHSVLNIANTDNRCFLYCILASLHPTETRPTQVDNYLPFQNDVNMSSITYPVSLSQIDQFENQNPNISVNVFGYEREEIIPLRITKQTQRLHHTNLLCLTQCSKMHYCLITNLNRFLSRINNHKAEMFHCVYCLHAFTKERTLKDHIPYCSVHGSQKITLPVNGKDNILKFKEYEKTLQVPFVIYADFETLNVKLTSSVPTSDSSSTTPIRKLEVCGFGYKVVSIDPRYTKPTVVYRGEDASHKLIESLIEEMKHIQQTLAQVEPMVLTSQNLKEVENPTHCCICKEIFTPFYIQHKNPVRHHNHVTGAFLGMAHNHCNLICKQMTYIPVIFHNLKNFDAHILCQSVGHFPEVKLKCIAQNSERYVSFSLGDLRFIDSYQFLPSSLESLVSDLSKEGLDAFPHLNSEFSTPEHALLLSRKGVYPYEYFDCSSKFQETSLPSKMEFYSHVKAEGISDEDFAHAHKVFDTLQLKNLGEYHDIYLKTDVLLLCDVFEAFRRVCLHNYQLDPAHFYTSPGFSWAACLKMTGVSLELMTDIDQILFVEKGIRGGISQVSNRFKTANNPYLETHDPSKPTSYLQYLDMNNLYGFAMVQKLPVGSFRFLSKREKQHFNIYEIEEDDDIGYILEVSLRYPKKYHDSHNDYPLAPEQKHIPSENLSPYAKRLWRLLHNKSEEDDMPPRTPVKKLLLTLEDKDHYVTHYKNLKLYLDLGLEIIDIHRILQFRQEAWMKPFIDFNTNMRKQATSSFQKNLYKLYNVSVFGKTMENVRKHKNIELVHRLKRLKKLSAKPTYKSSRIFSENLAAVELMRNSVKLFKPSYSGMCILDLSKHAMYDFYYNHLQQKYGSKMQLQMTDTDSFLFYCETEDIYKDMADHLDLYDTSDYPPDNFIYSSKNRKVLAKMKDETMSVPIARFAGLRSKVYAFSCGNREERRAKGVSKVTVKKELRLQHYVDTLFKETQRHSSMTTIRSHNHQLYCETLVKASLSAFDDKRYLLNATDSLSYGHYKIL